MRVLWFSPTPSLYSATGLPHNGGGCVGSCTDPSAYYRDAKIITMASYFEGWLLSLSEAMNCGCVPILFNSYLSAKDIVRSDSEGVLVKPFDVDEYAKRLTDLIQDEEHLKTMSFNAYCSSKRFSINNIVDQWMKILLRIGDRFCYSLPSGMLYT